MELPMTSDRATMQAVAKLRPNPRNARTHSKEQIKQVARAIARFGWTSPIVVDENFAIICGHARWEASKQLGLKHVPVLVLHGLSDAEKRALALADNKIPANAGWDRKRLAEELGDLSALLPECNLDLEITGFEPAEIDGLMIDLGNPEENELAAPCRIPDQPISRKGDRWRCGDHRVVCGNPCDRTDWLALMGRETATAVFADPSSVQTSATRGHRKPNHRKFARAADENSRSEFAEFLQAWMRPAAAFSEQGALHYIFIDWRHLGEMHDVGKAVFGPLQNMVVWNKVNASPDSLYRSQHQLILVYRNGKASHLNTIELGRQSKDRSNLWTYPTENDFRKDHFNELAKPIALLADAIKDCSGRNDIIVDPFLRSGTTLLAAERVGRRAYGLDSDPRFVDAAIRRWQACTKREAILTATGQTFTEVAHSSTKSRGAR
jgi:DNA modification methylase